MWLIRGNSLLMLVVIVLNLTLAQQESVLTNQLFIERIGSLPLFAPSPRLVTASSGQFLALASQKQLKLIDLGSFSEFASIDGIPQLVTSLSFSADGKQLFVGKVDGHITIWDVSTRKWLEDFSIHSSAVVSIGISSKKLVLTSSFDKTMRLSDPTMKNAIKSISRFPYPCVGFYLNPTESALSVVRESEIRIFSFPALEDLGVHSLQSTITVSAVSPQGSTIALGSTDGKVHLWNLESKSVKNVFKISNAAITALAFDSTGKWLACGTLDSLLSIITPGSGATLGNKREEKCYYTSLTFSGGKSLAAGTSTGQVVLWKVLEEPPDKDAPVIVIAEPEIQNRSVLKLFAKEVSVSGLVSDKSIVTSISIKGFDGPMQITEAGKVEGPQGSLTGKRFSAQVPLKKTGLNEFEITATDQYGNRNSTPFAIQRLSNDEALEILSPLPNTETDSIAARLRFRTWFDVESYQVIANMQEMITNRSPVKSNGVYSDKIPLVVGYNQIQIVVKSLTGEKFTRTLGVTKKVLGPLTTQTNRVESKGRTSEPQKWAVIVGVSEYQNRGIPSLKYADRDAQAFAEFLQKPEGGGYEPSHMRILLNKDATVSNLKEALLDFLTQAIDKDLVMIYFAGHGAPDPARPQNLYLLTHDSDPARLGLTAFPMWQIEDVLKRYISARRIVVFSDACHSGGISADFASRGLDVTKTNLINQFMADLSRTKEGTIVFTASAAGEVSQEFSEFSHGAFTYYLLEGMKGAADFNNDYTVTINELMQYVEDQVKRKTKGAQNPTRSQTTYDKELTISLIAH
ncbi:MAG: caspase family protein [bacterium]